MFEVTAAIVKSVYKRTAGGIACGDGGVKFVEIRHGAGINGQNKFLALAGKNRNFASVVGLGTIHWQFRGELIGLVKVAGAFVKPQSAHRRSRRTVKIGLTIWSK